MNLSDEVGLIVIAPERDGRAAPSLSPTTAVTSPEPPEDKLERTAGYKLAPEDSIGIHHSNAHGNANGHHIFRFFHGW